MIYEPFTIAIVPTLNPGQAWRSFLSAYCAQQSPRPHCIVLDSESTDCVVEESVSIQGVTLYRVSRERFSHGGTRQEAVDKFAANAEFVIFLTQDALLLAPDSLNKLMSGFDNPKVAAVYGRQVPHADANPIAAHSRLFNYPEKSRTFTLDDANKLGIRACFMSNSFGAYRLKAFKEVGGFSNEVILGEDMQIAARLLKAGYAVRYQADAKVSHSHNYSLLNEFRRYFDTGVFHSQQAALFQQFGRVTGSGLQFVRSEINYLLRNAPWKLPEAACRTLFKALAFKMGLAYKNIPKFICRRLSLSKGHWK